VGLLLDSLCTESLGRAARRAAPWKFVGMQIAAEIGDGRAGHSWQAQCPLTAAVKATGRAGAHPPSGNRSRCVPRAAVAVRNFEVIAHVVDHSWLGKHRQLNNASCNIVASLPSDTQPASAVNRNS